MKFSKNHQVLTQLRLIVKYYYSIQNSKIANPPVRHATESMLLKYVCYMKY